ncbi:serine hydrolase domain-containing protein [Streptomyces sp. NPDC059783]|uniref:serine hydrolase domain-containing protein n=1 Tax=Streptomyces sp. NPDC059783 TaxID=3346944 RepID=UPI0036492DDC
MTHTPTRTRRALVLAAALAATLSTALPSGPATARPGPPDVRELLRRDAGALVAAGATGVQARLVTAGGTGTTATAGVADRATGRPVPDTGHFRIASVTKTFLATVILQLAAEHRLSLDDTAERWLPGTVSGNGNDGRAITLRQLLTHTAGLHDDYPDYVSAADYREHRLDRYTAEETVARAMRHGPDFAPGTRWAYSNTGYVLLGMVVRRVTGNSWPQEVERRIVRPLGLRHTTGPGPSPALPRPHATTYQRFAPGEPLVDVTEQIGSGTNGEAGMISTTADLARFLRAVLGGRLLPPAHLALMKETVPVGPEFERFMPGARDGLGIFARPLSCGGAYWGHEGGDAGWITATGATEDGRHAVIVSLSGVLAASDDDVLRVEGALNRLVDDALCAARDAGPGSAPRPGR